MLDHAGSVLTMIFDLLNDLSSAEVEELATRFGTPFYLYDVDVLYRRIARVRAAFHEFAEVYFAVKANPNVKLLRAIRDAVDGLDISSGGELSQAFLAGYDPTSISFAGPAKKMEEVRFAIERHVGIISVESRRELLEIIQLSRALGVKAGIAIRINPKQNIKAFGIKMGGRPLQFGVDEENLDEVANLVVENGDALDFRGIHIYAGSQCFDVAGMADCVVNSLRMALAFEESVGQVCGFINLGGGFGVSHSNPPKELDVEALGAELASELCRITDRGRRRVIFELGRYLAADAGIYVTRVVSAKNSRGKGYFMVDGGLNHHLMAAGTFGSGLRVNFALRNLSQPNATPVKCNIAGPSCNPTDLMGVNVNVSAPKLGDLLGFGRSGSYGFTASPLLFLSHPTPAELIRQNGHVTLARSPRSVVDFN
jgi:diaminopimelate decarboxylase